MNWNTTRNWAAGLLIAALALHAVWREAYPHAGRESENLDQLRSWVRSSVGLAGRRLWALDRKHVVTGSALATLQADLGASLLEQQRAHDAERTTHDARLEALRAEQQSQTAGLEALRHALADLRGDLTTLQDPSALAARLDGLAEELASFQARQQELDTDWQQQFIELRQTADQQLERLASQLQSLEQDWSQELRARLAHFEPSFQAAVGNLSPGLYRLLLRNGDQERVLGAAFAVRADGVLATAGSVALEALQASFHEPGSVLEVEPCAGGARLPVLRQSIASGMRTGEATHDAALLKIDCRGRSLQVMPFGDARPTLASPIGIVFPRPGELGFVRGYTADSNDNSLRFRAQLPPGIAGAPIVSADGQVVAVHSGPSPDGVLASAAWSEAWAELLRDF